MLRNFLGIIVHVPFSFCSISTSKSRSRSSGVRAAPSFRVTQQIPELSWPSHIGATLFFFKETPQTSCCTDTKPDKVWRNWQSFSSSRRYEDVLNRSVYAPFPSAVIVSWRVSDSSVLNARSAVGSSAFSFLVSRPQSCSVSSRTSATSCSSWIRYAYSLSWIKSSCSAVA